MNTSLIAESAVEPVSAESVVSDDDKFVTAEDVVDE